MKKCAHETAMENQLLSLKGLIEKNDRRFAKVAYTTMVERLKRDLATAKHK